MRVLVISYLPPTLANSEAIVFFKTLRALSQRCIVQVITSDLDNGPMADSSLVSLMRSLDRVTIERYPTLPSLPIVWIKNVLDSVNYTMNSGAFDIIYSRSLPQDSHSVAAFVRRSFPNIPWVAQFNDPWAVHPWNDGQSLESYRRDKERDTLMQADGLVFCNDALRDHFSVVHGVDLAEKSTVIPHSFAPDLYPKDCDRPKTPIVFKHVGRFYGKRTPGSLLAAIDYIDTRYPKYRRLLSFCFTGHMDQESHTLIEEYRQRLAVPITISDNVNFTESLREMKESSALVLVEASDEHSIFLPSKLIDYMGANRPILGITRRSSTSAAILSKLGHWTASPTDSERIANTLMNMTDSLLDDTPHYQTTSLQYKFTDWHTADQLISFFQRVSGS